MAGKKESKNKINVRDIRDTSGDVNIAGRDIIKGWTAKQVSKFLKEFSSTFQLKPFNGNCPYKGLDVFEEHDAELFFGREKLVDDLINRVRNSRSLFITGPSGSGKSSLVRAGLVPALRLGKIKGSDQWLYETIKPGRDPIEALALAFSRLKSPELANYFRQHVDENNILNECAESALSNRKEQKLILFIDQFEEVFRGLGSGTIRKISKQDDGLYLAEAGQFMRRVGQAQADIGERQRWQFTGTNDIRHWCLFDNDGFSRRFGRGNLFRWNGLPSGWGCFSCASSNKKN